MDYVKHPQAIQSESLDFVGQYTSALGLGPVEDQIYRRIIHTTGDPAIVPLIAHHPQFVTAVYQVLTKKNFTIYTDVNMIRTGISEHTVVSLGGQVVCRIGDAAVAAAASEAGETRAMTAARMSQNLIKDNLVVVGNAPTALFTILEMAAEGWAPAAIVGTPVGFVGAKESKELLEQADIPYLTIRGTRGGSTIAAAVVNALLYSLKD
ncbi:precorrin-8X methylmutase [Metallumcola ferriviriculae]|uniref:Precorrin-8X methylmutase n=1 Tax=Metallumcola ferriviriculae TaxID=3039180 RepID=A0AAU0URH0_9FIRM|nr:precorrin-8X methylmutase [Desulfitibacteraceae bacterium MK1]